MDAKEMNRMNGKVVIITGGGRGIGRSTALLFSSEEAKVVVASRNESELKRTSREIKKSGGEFLGLKCDVRKTSDIRRVVSATPKKFGRIDILVNNAGVVYQGPLDEMKENEVDEQIDTNLRGLIHFCRIVVPHMVKQRGGVIVNVASGAGHHAFENLAVYCATKSGVLAVTSSLAKEVGRHGVKVFAVCPGAVDTKMQEKILGSKVYRVAKLVMIRPEKIANKILELASGKSSASSGGCANVYF